jgi:hypothetical protein
MTRTLVILIAALAAASLGASAQEHTTANQGKNVTTASSAQSTRPAQPSSSAPAAGVRSPDSATSSPNQGIQASDPADADSPNRAQLPQTSTILPLLGLIGLGSLLAGLFARR